MDRRRLEDVFQKVIIVGLYGFALTSPWSVAGAGGAIILCLLGWMGKSIFMDRKRWPRSPLDLPILAYLGAQFLSFCFSPYRFNSLKAFKGEWIVLFFFLLMNNLREERVADRLLKVLVSVTSLISIYAIWQHFFGLDLYRHRLLQAKGNVFISTGLFGHHLTYGGYVMVILLFSLAFFLWGATKWRSLYGVSILFSGLGLLFSYARSSWFGLVGGVLSMALIKGKKVLIPTLAGMVFLGGLIILTQPTIRERITDAVDISNPSSGTRIRLWQTSWRMVKDRPLLGVGLGNFKRFFNQYKVTGHYDSISHSHNDLLNVGVNAGLLGVLGFLWIWWAFWRSSLKGYRQTSHPIFLGGFSSAVAFFLASLLQCYYTDAEDGMLLWFVFGLVMAFYGIQRGKAEQPL